MLVMMRSVSSEPCCMLAEGGFFVLIGRLLFEIP